MIHKMYIGYASNVHCHYCIGFTLQNASNIFASNVGPFRCVSRLFKMGRNQGPLYAQMVTNIVKFYNM